MATRVETAYRKLRDVLQAAAAASDACPDTVHRNRLTTDLLEAGRTGAASYLNLVDEKGRLLAQEMNAPGEDGAYEILQRAMLEVVVYEPDDALRDAKFDDIMQALAAIFEALDPALGGVVSEVIVDEPPDRMLLAGYPAVKAGRVAIDLLISAPTVFG